MRVFLACSFTRYIREVSGELSIDPDFQRFIVRVEQSLVRAGHEVFLAIRVEDFGKSLRPAALCTPMDMIEMDCADCVVAIPQSSYGVHIELGWATAMNKPIVLVEEDGARETTPLLSGMPCVGRVRRVRVADGFLSSDIAQSQLCRSIAEALSALPMPTRRAKAHAFVSTSFGFGPVSKAAAIARELKGRAPDHETHFFGAGVDFDFAEKSEAFDRVYKLDVDDEATVEHLAPALARYESVFSIMNHHLLRHWQKGGAPLYLVDSLAWMWPSAPEGLDKVTTYFIQDYMLPSDTVERMSVHAPVSLVGPIESASSYERKPRRAGVRQLLVNLSGCANPFAKEGLYDGYVDVLSDCVLRAADGRFDRVVFCCNERLSERLRARFEGNAPISAGHFSHDRFMQLMAGSDFLLTSPGITTTLEAVAFGVPTGFLLPQNYSQALLSERYRDSLGDESCMALSRFGDRFLVAPAMDEELGVATTLANLGEVLATRAEDIARMVTGLLDVANVEMLARLKRHVRGRYAASGQDAIVTEVLSNGAARVALTRRA